MKILKTGGVFHYDRARFHCERRNERVKGSCVSDKEGKSPSYRQQRPPTPAPWGSPVGEG